MADSTPNNCIGQVQTQRETLDEVEGLPFCVLLFGASSSGIDQVRS